MKKRLLCAVLALMLVLSVFPVTAFAASSVTKSVFNQSSYPTVSGNTSETIYGSVALDVGGTATDSGTLTYYTSYGLADAVNHNWDGYMPVVSSNSGVATAKVLQSGSTLAIEFTGVSDGTATITIEFNAQTRVNADQIYSGTTGYALTHLVYTVTVGTGSGSGSGSGSENPDAPAKPGDSVIEGITGNYGAVRVACKDNSYHQIGKVSDLTAHSDGWFLSDVVPNDGSFTSYGATVSGFPWMCELILINEYWVDLWNRNFAASNGGTHYEWPDNGTISFHLFYGTDGEWYYITDEVPQYVYIQHTDEHECEDADDDGFCDKCGETCCTHTDKDSAGNCLVDGCVHGTDCCPKDHQHTDEDPDDGKCDECGDDHCTHTKDSAGNCLVDGCVHGTDCCPKDHQHTDEDDDGVCDECGESYCTHTDKDSQGNCLVDDCKHGTDCCPKDHQHTDVEPDDGKCDECGDDYCAHAKDDNNYCTVEGCAHGETCCPKAPVVANYQLTYQVYVDGKVSYTATVDVAEGTSLLGVLPQDPVSLVTGFPNKHAVSSETEGWSLNGAALDADDVMPAEAVTVVANLYNVFPVYQTIYTLDAAGNTVSTERKQVGTITAKDYMNFELLTPAVAGYTFNGWYQAAKDMGSPTKKLDALKMAKKYELYGQLIPDAVPAPDGPSMQALRDMYLKVAIDCDTNDSHDGTYQLYDSRVAGMNFGEVVANDGTNPEFPVDEWPWQCYVSLRNEYWFNLFKSDIASVEARFTTIDHIMVDETEDVGFMVYCDGDGFWWYEQFTDAGNLFTLHVTHK